MSHKMFPCIDIRGIKENHAWTCQPCYLVGQMILLAFSPCPRAPRCLIEVSVCFRKVVVTLVVVALGLTVYFHKADGPVGAVGFFE